MDRVLGVVGENVIKSKTLKLLLLACIRGIFLRVQLQGPLELEVVGLSSLSLS